MAQSSAARRAVGGSNGRAVRGARGAPTMGESFAPPERAANTTEPALADAVRRARAGDVDAFGVLYCAHAPAVLALCRRMLGNDQDARDALQDVFVRAWEKLGSYRGDSVLRTWLHRLGVNVILERLRSARREALRFADDADDVAPAGPTPAQRSDDALDLAAALERLPHGSRMVLVLHDLDGYSHEEIAAMLGIAPGTSRAQLWRARRHLSRMLDP